MRDMGTVPYVLREHRSLPAAEQPVWNRRVVRVRDFREARAAATVDDGDGKSHVDSERFCVELLARVLRRLSGAQILCDSIPLEVPAGDLSDMREWIDRLPMRWAHELGVDAARDSEPTPEEERGSSS